MSNSQHSIRKRLDEYKAKPLVPLELAGIRQAITAPDFQLEQLKPYIARDPILSHVLLKAGFRVTRNRPSHPFAADHAVSLIGQQGMVTLLDGYQNRAPTRLSSEMVYSLSSSLLAAEIARAIGELILLRPQTYWTALAYQFPHTLLWHLEPKAMWKIYYRMLSQPHHLAEYETSLLGFSLFDWRRAVGKVFNLSEDLKTLYAQPVPQVPKELVEYIHNGYSNKTPSLKNWHGQEGWLVLLSNRLARSIINPWHSRSYQHACQLISALTGFKQARLTTIITASVRKVSADLFDSSLLPPAVAHLQIKDRRLLPRWLRQPKPVKTNKVFDNLCLKISQRSDRFSRSTQLIQVALKAAIDHLGFLRASFLTIDHDAKSVVTKMALTAKGQSAISPDFNFRRKTPLNQFIEQGLFEVVELERITENWPALPEAIRLERVERFVIFSLKPGKRVLGLIYVDADELSVFNDDNIKLLGKLLKALNVGLVKHHQAQQKKRAKG